MNKNFFITTAIHYSSGLPHIGHAYENILADSIARYKRLIGFDVMFLTGLDEHGQKIAEIATKNNMDVVAWTDHIHVKFQELWDKLHISNDKFIRTTDKYHVESVQKIFSKMLSNNDIYLGSWKGLYCVGCEEQYTEEEAIKKEDGLYCRVGHKLIETEEPSYFFKMSEYTNWIKNYFEQHPNFTIPSYRMIEMSNNFINKGLEDLSISRTKFDWGIQILENSDHVIYVWLDALFNYVTALGFEQQDDRLYKKFWADEQSEVLHVVGKDIVRFHTIFWPIMLHSLQMRIPNHVIGHGWIMAEDGRKMSKSFGNVVDPNELIDKYGSDIVRYYFIKEFQIDSDNNFSENKLIETYNSDLANIFGNIVSRTIGMINLYSNGSLKQLTNTNTPLIQARKNFVNSISSLINSFNIKDVLVATVNFGKEINKYIEEKKPWELKKENKFDEINDLLFELTDAIRAFTIILQPVLTNGTKLMKEQMNFTNEMMQFSEIDNANSLVGLKVNTSTPIYERIKKA
ncbi:MAG: methionine--tRNA ligase [Mycoplasmataceae bacterium]|nr:methionine--tRNA ligase [Mycoplasmataceae bacterium]